MKDKKQPKGNLILILHFTPHQEAKDFLRLDIFNPIMHPGVYWVKPSLNTQSCIMRFLVVQDICFYAIWAAGPVLKEN